MKKENELHPSSAFANKVWITVGITSLVVILILIIYKTFNVFLLLLAASLIALFFSVVSGKVNKWTGLKDGVALAVTIVFVVIVVEIGRAHV